jgi:phosphoglycerate dehydrogenase-like enzyme
MRSVICVHERFDAMWPFSADHWHQAWQQAGCELYRTEESDARPSAMVPDPETVTRLVLLGFYADSTDMETFSGLEEIFHSEIGYPNAAKDNSPITEAAVANGINFVMPRGELFWGQSVAEYGLALTLCALRRIPQTYVAMMQGHETWQYYPKVGKPGQRGAQYGDDNRFTSGTLRGKRVRVVGIGNIGARYAAWCANMGADVAVWDPFAPDATFAVAGVKDAEIFVPMVPLIDGTRGLVTADLINALPQGCLVVQVTRARVCDTEALYKRVLNNELSLAADVFFEEPLPLDSPLIGRENVVHTPHNAGRTIQANQAWADDQMARFRPR